MFVQSELFVVDLFDLRDVGCQACGDGDETVLGVWFLDPNDDALYGEFCKECLIERAEDWNVPVCAVADGLVKPVTEASVASS
jgi:hypothetical protein